MTIFQVIFQDHNGFWRKYGGPLSFSFQILPNVQACSREHPFYRSIVLRGTYQQVEGFIERLNMGMPIEQASMEAVNLGHETAQGESPLDVARRKWELERPIGGGPYEPTPYTLEGLGASTLGHWATLAARVQRGTLGGKFDGEAR